MDHTDTTVSRLEQALNIKFEKADKTNENSYYDGSKLCLSRLHFENFSALEPVFETLKHLILIECSITCLQDIHKLKLETLTLKKCSVSIDGTFNPDAPKERTSHGHFRCLHLENMNVPHPGFFLPVSNHLEYVTFTKCTVSNICELNLFPALYHLTFNGTSFTEPADDIQYQRQTVGKFTFLNFENMKLKDFDLFVPISEGLSILNLYNCEMESLKSICQFSDLKRLRLHPDIQINDLSIPDNDAIQFELEECMISRKPPTYGWDRNWIIPDFNTELLASVAPYIRSLTIEDYNLVNTPYLKHFPRLNELYFESCSINLDDYSLIAPQIQQMTFNATEVKNQEAFRDFTKLENIKFRADHPDRGHYIDLKKLLPLKESLKGFEAWDWNHIGMIQNIDELKHFTVLEKLNISADSPELTADIFSITSLKELQITIEEQTPEPPDTIILDLQQLKNVEKLILYTFDDIYFKGIGQLKSLKTLELSNDGDLENLADLPSLEKLTAEGEIINKLPKLAHVKVLNLKIKEGCEVILPEKFPNVEKLKIKISKGQKIDFKGLKNLKVLVFEGNNFDSIISLENLPGLEELDLGDCKISGISKLDYLTGLKTLNLAENKIESIEGLENLKTLERLNLNDNKITDFSPLNKHPALREVNIPTYLLKKEDIEKQLDKPEIVLSVHFPFSISIEESLYM